MPYIPLFVADYLADTSHLSTLEHGAYLLLIMNYWQRGESLPCGDMQLARIARMTPKEWSVIRPAISEFFTEDDGKWVHGRIDAELAKVRNKSETRAKAGKASAQAKAQQKRNKSSTLVEQNLNYTDTDTDTDTDTKTEDDGIVSTGATFVPRETGIPHTDQFSEIETALREAAGWQREPHPNLAVVGPVIEAIKAGVDLELDLLPAARAHGPTLRKRTSWNYIIQVAITNRDNRLQAASNAAKPINAMPTNGPRHGKPTDRTGNLAALIGDQPGRF